jgi:hypothetical protein
MMNAVISIVFIEVEDRFGIAISGIAMTALFEYWSKFGMIVDFSVEDDPKSSVFIAHGLMPTRQINNAEATKPKCDGA